jgi:hypothetical protein
MSLTRMAEGSGEFRFQSSCVAACGRAGEEKTGGDQKSPSGD